MNKKAFWIAIIFYAAITFIRILNHQTWYDETRAWLIAEHLNLFEIFDLMKTEGHTFIWYVLLMPFAKAHWAFPYSMLILNWLFCLSAVLVMWIYAPFNTGLKILITFSSPFFILYSILARCYAIGILFLFILAVMFKDKSRHPYLYSFLIFFCANTSIMATVGALSFAVLFLYDLIKTREYKTLIGCGFICVLCIITLFLQLYGANPTTALPEMTEGLRLDFFLNIFIFPKLINLILLVIIVPLIWFIFKKSKPAFLFLTMTYSMLLIIFHFVYLGVEWHHYFFYIYLIIATWLFLQSENVSQKYKNILSYILICVSFFYVVDLRHRNGAYNSGSKILARKVIDLKGSGIIFVGKSFFQILPYIEKENVSYYYSYTLDKIVNPIKSENLIERNLNFDVIYKICDSRNSTYLFLLEKDKKLSDFEMAKNNKVLKFNLQEVFGKNVFIYNVQKIK